MFYSETLLSKTGPLARVWLSANLEKKLSKNHVLQSNIETSVNAIVDQGQAPLALRLSGQLLLGVVRIYSRKARYLLDDCNEAIMKIRMAFRPGNVDLPTASNTANAASLVLPDVITELDLLAPLPDASFLLGDFPSTPRRGPDPTLLNFGSGQRLPSSFERVRRASPEPTGLLPDLDLDLDTGEDLFSRRSRERSVEVGRNAPTPRPIADEMEDTSILYNGPDLELDFGQSGFDTLAGDVTMTDLGAGEIADDIPAVQSPAVPMVDDSFLPEEETIVEADEEVRHAQRAKRRRVLQADSETEIRSAEIRALQNDRSKILKPASFLPKDPFLLALMQLQREGKFVSSILGDGRQRGLAPELRGILSLEVVRKSAELKRKRAAPRPDPEDLIDEIPVPILEDEALYQPGGAFEFGNESSLHIGDEPGLEYDQQQDDTIMPSSRPGTADLDHHQTHHDNFDETVAPILHPADSGPVSQGTKHAVHLLRELFGPEAASTTTPSKRTKASVLFQDMLPEATTTRAEATKMFFEVLVLATKDAIKVEQEDVLGGPLRMRGKRGLWGSWVEESTATAGEVNAVAGATEIVA